MDIEKFLNEILGVVNGQRAWDWVAKISQFNRVQASNGYHDSLETIKEELVTLGFDDIEHFKSPADGETKSWGYQAPYQWEIETGELWIEEPEKTKLCDFNDIPVSIVTHSKPCDVTAEVKDIGIGDKKEDYERNDINGKIILMSGPIFRYRPYIEESGAIGVIYYPDLVRTRDNFDRRIYNGFFTTKERLKNSKFGFSISYNQAMHLKELMQKGTVNVKASIKSEFMEGDLEVLTTSIKGTEHPDQEIVIIAHLCHPLPSANDNASGAAGLLELARAFRYSIDKKVLEKPKRTIRFVWVPEYNGTVPWMKYHENKIRNVLACINLDMIGEHPLKIGQPLEVNLAPHSTPSILNDIASFFVKRIADHPKGIAINGTKVPMSYRLKSFDGGSDHVLFIDSYFGIPSLMFGHEDPHYHSSMDTVEYCDSTELKRVIAMALSISYTLSILEGSLINFFWPLMHLGLYKRIGNSIKLLDELSLSISRLENKIEMEEGKELFLLGQDILNACFQYELESLEWIRLIDNSSDVLLLIKSAKDEMHELFEYQRLRWNEKFDFDEEDIKTLKSKFSYSYELNFEGPFLADDLFKLTKTPIFKEFIEELEYEFLGPINELINLIGKGYNILHISSLLSLEYKMLVKPNKIVKLVNHLEREQLIKKK
jgi:aminopeptidase-like protein